MAYLNNILRNIIKQTLQQDGVIAFVTDTVWGLGCLPKSENGVKKIYEIKKREAQKPLILMSNEVENLLPYVKPINEKAKELINNHFPGALTLVLEKSDKTPDYITSGFDMVGIRIPANDVFKEICEAAPGHVLATTSANLSGEPSAKTYEDALKKIGSLADIVINDFEQHAKGLESTVVLITADEVKILRQGAIVL